jgi:hypothetical protein
MSAGTFWGILALIAVIVPVLGGFGGLFVFWMMRAKALEKSLAEKSAAIQFPVDEPSVDEVVVWRTETGATPPAIH